MNKKLVKEFTVKSTPEGLKASVKDWFEDKFIYAKNFLMEPVLNSYGTWHEITLEGVAVETLEDIEWEPGKIVLADVPTRMGRAVTIKMYPNGEYWRLKVYVHNPDFENIVKELSDSLCKGFKGRKDKESLHFAYDQKRRLEIVAEFRAKRKAGNITNFEAFAKSHGISDKTLRSYLEEFPEK